MTESLELIKDLDGAHLDEFIAAASGMTRAEFAMAIANKGQQRYLIPTQNADRCNQKCSHCFMTERDRSSAGNPISDEQLTDLMALYKERGYRTYMYFQEPMMRDDYFEKIEQFPQETSEINPAFFVTKKDLAKRVIDLGVTTIKHSIHGTQQEHCALTRSTPRLYQLMLDGMAIIKAAGLQLGIETTFYQGNRYSVEYLADLLAARCVDDWYIGRAIPVGAAKEWSSDKFLRGHDARQVAGDIARAIHRKAGKMRIRFESNWGPNFLSKWHYDYLLGRVDGEPVKSTYWCDAIDTHLLYASVETGRVYPCFYHLAFEDEALGAYDAQAKDLQLVPSRVERWTAA